MDYLCTTREMEGRTFTFNFFYHKFDGFKEALVELGVLEIVLWVVGAVHHPT